MRQPVIVLCVLFLASCAANEFAETAGGSASSDAARARARARVDQSDGAPAMGMFRPDQVSWKDGPPSLPSGAQFALLEGDPSQPGFFAMRLKLPDGYRIPPHTHPNVERVTVISGTFNLGMSGTFDRSQAQAFPAGSYAFMEPGMKHFAWTQGETIIQIATIGPWKINYVNPADDPRKK